jgi:hypothetical protein
LPIIDTLRSDTQHNGGYDWICKRIEMVTQLFFGFVPHLNLNKFLTSDGFDAPANVAEKQIIQSFPTSQFY